MIDEQAQRLSFLEEWNRLLRSQRFGARSEKVPAEQSRLFNEAELAAVATDEYDWDGEVDVPAHKLRKRGNFVTSIASLRKS